MIGMYVEKGFSGGIISRYTEFGANISSEAEMLYLESPAYAPPKETEYETNITNITHINNVIEQNPILNLQMDMRFLDNMITNAVTNIANTYTRHGMMLERPAAIKKEGGRVYIDQSETRERVKNIAAPREQGRPATAMQVIREAKAVLAAPAESERLVLQREKTENVVSEKETRLEHEVERIVNGKSRAEHELKTLTEKEKTVLRELRTLEHEKASNTTERERATHEKETEREYVEHDTLRQTFETAAPAARETGHEPAQLVYPEQREQVSVQPERADAERQKQGSARREGAKPLETKTENTVRREGEHTPKSADTVYTKAEAEKPAGERPRAEMRKNAPEQRAELLHPSAEGTKQPTAKAPERQERADRREAEPARVQRGAPAAKSPTMSARMGEAEPARNRTEDREAPERIEQAAQRQSRPHRPADISYAPQDDLREQRGIDRQDAARPAAPREAQRQDSASAAEAKGDAALREVQSRAAYDNAPGHTAPAASARAHESAAPAEMALPQRERRGQGDLSRENFDSFIQTARPGAKRPAREENDRTEQTYEHGETDVRKAPPPRLAGFPAVSQRRLLKLAAPEQGAYMASGIRGSLTQARKAAQAAEPAQAREDARAPRTREQARRPQQAAAQEMEFPTAPRKQAEAFIPQSARLARMDIRAQAQDDGYSAAPKVEYARSTFRREAAPVYASDMVHRVNNSQTQIEQALAAAGIETAHKSENKKGSATVTNKTVEKHEAINAPGKNPPPPVITQAMVEEAVDLSKITDKVYKALEARIRSEKMRRGF